MFGLLKTLELMVKWWCLLDNDSVAEFLYEHQHQNADAVKDRHETFAIIVSNHNGSSEPTSSAQTNSARALHSLQDLRDSAG